MARSVLELIEADESLRPALFSWNGRLDRAQVVESLRGLSHAPDELVALWVATGGGTMFESEEVLSPIERPPDGVLGRSQWRADHGLSLEGLLFHEGGLGLSAVRPDGSVAVHRRDGRLYTDVATLAAWYRDIIRAEYAARYELPP